MSAGRFTRKTFSEKATGDNRNVFFVPMRQDDCEKKPRSVVADFSKTYDAILSAVQGKQIQPIYI